MELLSTQLRRDRSQVKAIDDWKAQAVALVKAANRVALHRRVEALAGSSWKWAPWLALAFLAYMQFSTPLVVRSQFFAENDITGLAGCAYLDGGDEMKTNEKGRRDIAFSSCIPGRHKVRFEPLNLVTKKCDSAAAAETSWMAPLPFALDTRFYFNAQSRSLTVAGINVSPPQSPVLSAAGRQSPTQAAPAFYELGVMLDAIRIDTVPGFLGIRRPTRGFFRVSMDSEHLTDAEVSVASPLTIKRGANFFPVESVPDSWVLIQEGGRGLKNMFCRIPSRFVRRLTSRDTLELSGRLKLDLIGNTAQSIATFDLANAFATPLWETTTVTASSGKRTLTVRPVLSVRHQLDVQWPDKVTLTSGQPSTIVATLQDEHSRTDIAAPFEIELALTVEGDLLLSPPPTSVAFRTGQTQAQLSVSAGKAGSGKISSRMPKSVGASHDDVAVSVVTGSKSRSKKG